MPPHDQLAVAVLIRNPHQDVLEPAANSRRPSNGAWSHGLDCTCEYAAPPVQLAEHEPTSSSRTSPIRPHIWSTTGPNNTVAERCAPALADRAVRHSVASPGDGRLPLSKPRPDQAVGQAVRPRNVECLQLQLRRGRITHVNDIVIRMPGHIRAAACPGQRRCEPGPMEPAHVRELVHLSDWLRQVQVRVRLASQVPACARSPGLPAHGGDSRETLHNQLIRAVLNSSQQAD